MSPGSLVRMRSPGPARRTTVASAAPAAAASGIPVQADGHRGRGRASHGLITRLDELASRRGYRLTYSVGWELAERERKAIRLVPEEAWQIAIDSRGEVRERRADDACADRSCAHCMCWIEEAHVAEPTGILRPDRERAGVGTLAAGEDKITHVGKRHNAASEPAS
jgi:hypothetical protein